MRTAMEEPAAMQQQQEKMEASQEHGEAGWKSECSLSTFLKHSCLLCWSSPRDADATEADDRVLAKKAEIRELENAVALESLELQEQQSDKLELEETLEKLEKHKEKLVQQIKNTRQLCYEESQQILSLQAEEAKKENQVEEYERELARARWRLKKLREEVKKAKKKVEEAGERDIPLQDSIRQSYEEILQEENTLCSLSGGMVTPDSQLDQSASPADTTEDDPLPLRPWGRSQSLPAYADLIMAADGLPFCNNLACTREEQDSGTSSSKDRSDIEEEGDAAEIQSEDDKDAPSAGALTQLDFYRDDPFTHCHSDHDLFNDDLFPKTDTSDGFASDPFKGTDPFAADVLFPDGGGARRDPGLDGGCEEADTSLSCAENKASTGTQCFESEFPDEDSDIEISYSREDLDAIAPERQQEPEQEQEPRGFKPIQSSSEELAPEPVPGWRSKGQYSVESDPNGYELDLGPISPPSNVEELSLGSLGGNDEGAAPEEGRSSSPVRIVSGTDDLGQSLPLGSAAPSVPPGWPSTFKDQHPVTPHSSVDSQNKAAQPDSQHSSFELSYEQTSQSSFDPYGFKLSPEHNSNSLLDPDEEARQSPECSGDDEDFQHQASELHFHPFGFDVAASRGVHDSDPYGFKLSPEEENQEVLDLSDQDPEPTGFCDFENSERAESPGRRERDVCENQEVLDPFRPDLLSPQSCGNSPNQEVPEPLGFPSEHRVAPEDQQILDLSYENQEVVEPCPRASNEQTLEPFSYGNQEVLELSDWRFQDLDSFLQPENQEVPDVENQELLDFGEENQEVVAPEDHHDQDSDLLCGSENQQLVDFGGHDNQEILDLSNREKLPEANNNQRIIDPEVHLSSSSNSSDSDLMAGDPLRSEFTNTNICASNLRNRVNTADTVRVSGGSDQRTSAAALQQQTLLEGDLGSVFSAGGYIGCPDVADDLEPLGRKQQKQQNPAVEPAQPVKPVRPPRPSLRGKDKAASRGIDLK